MESCAMKSGRLLHRNLHSNCYKISNLNLRIKLVESEDAIYCYLLVYICIVSGCKLLCSSGDGNICNSLSVTSVKNPLILHPTSLQDKRSASIVNYFREVSYEDHTGISVLSHFCRNEQIRRNRSRIESKKSSAYLK